MVKNLIQQAVIHHQSGRLDRAIALYQAIIEANPNAFDAHQLMGAAWIAMNDLDRAKIALDKALDLRPFHPAVVSNYSIMLQNQDKAQAALDLINQALKHHPQDMQLWSKKSLLAYHLGDLKAAQVSLDFIFKQNAAPPPTEALNLQGALFLDQKQYEQALPYCAKAAENGANDASILSNYALALSNCGQHQKAKEIIARALALNPTSLQTRRNDCLIALSSGRDEAATRKLAALVESNPQDDDLNYFYGQTLLAAATPEQMLDGFTRCERRWNCSFMRKEYCRMQIINSPIPYWAGERAQKITHLAIFPEFGYGDFIHMLRYVPPLNKLGIKTTLILGQHYKAIAPLLRQYSCFEDYVETLSDAEMHARGIDGITGVMSLPLIHMRQLRVADPIIGPVRLTSDPASEGQMQTLLYQKGLRPTDRRIGLVVQGNPDHVNDHFRSIDLGLAFNKFASALEDKPHENSIKFILITPDKTGLGDQQRDQKIINMGGAVKNFADSAALIRNLDLLITIDSAPAHLAGSLGIPTWLLLPQNADWRWQYCSDPEAFAARRTRLYPAFQLFRQFDAEKGWPPVLEQVSQALKTAL